MESFQVLYVELAAWLRGNLLVLITAATLHWVWLVLVLVRETVC